MKYQSLSLLKRIEKLEERILGESNDNLFLDFKVKNGSHGSGYDRYGYTEYSLNIVVSLL